MYSVWVLVAGAFFVWASILSFLIWKQNNFLKSLFPKSGERDIRKKFIELISEINNFKLSLGGLEKKALEIEKKGLSHIQKIELMRFNPYQDTGGDQSFVLVLLDDKGSGLIITSLHARSGTRIFAKEVILGRAGKHKFSQEEEKAIKKALES